MFMNDHGQCFQIWTGPKDKGPKDIKEVPHPMKRRVDANLVKRHIEAQCSSYSINHLRTMKVIGRVEVEFQYLE